MNLYIHIPFCLSRCNYCHYTSFVIKKDNEKIKEYFAALKKEFQTREIDKIDTIYFGGGTPSLVPTIILENFLNKIYPKFINSKIEITMEVNPRNINEEYIKEISKIGINRISIGIQSFAYENVLKKLNRKYDNFQEKDLDIVFKYFTNVNFDIIQQLPFTDYKIFKNDLKKAFSYPIKHIAIYEYENYNNLENVQKGEEIERMEKYKTYILNKNKFERYEISNYAKKGYYCKHNLDFWLWKDYIGLGCSAVSQVKNIIRENPYNLKDYFNGKYKEYKLTEKEILDNFLARKLRTKFGFTKKEFKKFFKINFKIKREYKKFFVKDNKRIILNRKGMDFIGLLMKSYFFNEEF
ncbi:MAG TPA: coproporphyrinogen-III oxidase family protein [bacterium]|nr:coproporphyrinogen-III oxidase family protein [bacterium]HOL46891.1 coproporphyrinogen-III oxidase family protein [bacterium]HPQ18760.1 coproporphyrinogen-III oxidase family protein [bacterium]